MYFVKQSLRVLILCFFIVALTGGLCRAQDVPIEVFPRVMIGLSGGMFRPAMAELSKDHNHSMVAGVQLAAKLVSFHPRHHLYGTAQAYTFASKRLGNAQEVTGGQLSGLLKWHMRTVNAGLRYAVRLFKGNEITWVGSGVSFITLDRNVITSSRKQVRFLEFEEVRNVDQTRFESFNVFIEVGQMVQSFAFNGRPRLGLFWNAKYDHGRSAAHTIGGLSIQAGALVGL